MSDGRGPSDRFYDRMMAAGKTHVVTADDGDPLLVVEDADWAESTERLDAFMADHDRLVAENERLRAFIARLEISIMHPDMGGHHQARVRANGQRLTPEEWAIVHAAGPEGTT